MNDKRSAERLKSGLKADILDPAPKELFTKRSYPEHQRGGLSIQPRIREFSPAVQIQNILDLIKSIELDGRVVEIKRDPFHQLSRVKFEPLSMRQRIKFNRFLIGRITSVRYSSSFTRRWVGWECCGFALMPDWPSIPRSSRSSC